MTEGVQKSSMYQKLYESMKNGSFSLFSWFFFFVYLQILNAFSRMEMEMHYFVLIYDVSLKIKGNPVAYNWISDVDVFVVNKYI